MLTCRLFSHSRNRTSCNPPNSFAANPVLTKEKNNEKGLNLFSIFCDRGLLREVDIPLAWALGSISAVLPVGDSDLVGELRGPMREEGKERMMGWQLEWRRCSCGSKSNLVLQASRTRVRGDGATREGEACGGLRRTDRRE